MADVTIVYWRDIPAQVIVGKGRRGTKRALPERFEQAIDRAAMKAGLTAALGGLPGVVEVRGMGLMIGIELVADDALTPAAAQAEAVRASCLEKGVLVGVGGVFGNVVRIQPPLVITREQIDFALDALERTLAEVAAPQAYQAVV